MSYEFGLDEFLPVDQCRYCGVKHPAMQAVTGNITTQPFHKDETYFWKVYKCNSCGNCTIAQTSYSEGYVEFILPQPKGYEESIPERAREYLKQASDTLHAPAASVMVAASAVDEMLKARGLTKGKLYPRIKEAVETHLITEEMGEWAHEVRLEANAQRHADDEYEMPDKERAENILEFAEALAQFLFVLPSRVQAGLENSANSASAD
jgi:hypothetical protein